MRSGNTIENLGFWSLNIYNFILQDDIKDYLTSKGVEWEESTDLMEVASKCDVVYQTRIQKERFGERIDQYEEARGKYIVDQNVLDVMQKHAVVMHPLPRLDEVTMWCLSDVGVFFMSANIFKCFLCIYWFICLFSWIFADYCGCRWGSKGCLF